MAESAGLAGAIFLVTVIAVAALFVGGTAWGGRAGGETLSAARRWASGAAVGVVLWLALTGGLAAAGLLRDFSRVPPPMLALAGASGLLTLALAMSPLGARLSLGLGVFWLVGFQAFRIPVEIVLAMLYHAGAVPVQMTIEGRNFDMVSGISALLVAWMAARGRLPAWGLLLWNLLGLGLLLNIVIVSALSVPSPFRVFLNEPANTIVAEAPFVWLPVFLVQAALFGHLLVFRRLWRDARLAVARPARVH
jgi:hypothetical protein